MWIFSPTNPTYAPALASALSAHRFRARSEPNRLKDIIIGIGSTRFGQFTAGFGGATPMHFCLFGGT